MKHKVSELEGALLDAAVAKAEGKLFEVMPDEWGETAAYLVLMVSLPEFPLPVVGDKVKFCPSTDWRIGGPIIERERIVPVYYGPDWWADVGVSVGPGGDVETASGRWPITGAPTYLIAAMRAYVASKLGETVELP